MVVAIGSLTLGFFLQGLSVMAEQEPAKDHESRPRGQRARRDPPILDLSAETETSAAEASEESKPSRAPNALKAETGVSWRLWLIPALSVFAGIVIGAGLFELGSSYLPYPDQPSARLDSIEMALSQLASPSDVKARDAQIAALEKSVAELKSAPPQKPFPAPDLAPLMQRMTALEALVTSLKNHPSTPEEATGRLAARLALIGLIRDRLDRGVPFGRELATLTALDQSAPLPKSLSEVAVSGLPTAAQLAEDARTMPLPSAVSETPPNEPPPSLSGRILGGLEKFVTITPVDRPNSPSLDRGNALRDALAAQDLTRALALSEQNHAPSPYDRLIEQARSRIAAEATLDALERETISALAAEATR
jgi:hypothetical protein